MYLALFILYQIKYLIFKTVDMNILKIWKTICNHLQGYFSKQHTCRMKYLKKTDIS